MPPTTATRLALIEQAQVETNAKLDELLKLAKATNGRVGSVERQETICRASGVIGLPERVRALEDIATEMRSVGRVAKWAVGGGLAGAVALLWQAVQVVTKGGP